MAFTESQVMNGIQYIGFSTAVGPIEQVEPRMECKCLMRIVFKLGQYQPGNINLKWFYRSKIVILKKADQAAFGEKSAGRYSLFLLSLHKIVKHAGNRKTHCRNGSTL